MEQFITKGTINNEKITIGNQINDKNKEMYFIDFCPLMNEIDYLLCQRSVRSRFLAVTWFL